MMKSFNRIASICVLAGIIALGAAAASDAAPGTDTVATVSPEIAYLEQVNAWQPVRDPQLLFILMAQYANAGQHERGIAYFEALRKRYDAALSPAHRALYMLAVASLRAGHADKIFVLRRIGWVRDTLAMIDEANRTTGNTLFVGRWMSGIVRSKVPGFFGEREQASRDIAWCIDHVDQAPHLGWLRELYFAQARLARAAGDEVAAARAQRLSGYTESDRPVVLTTPFSASASEGYRFAPEHIVEVVPGSVYALSGYEFTEFYFIVSADRKELISIDAGTRGDSMKAALDALRRRVPDLPPLTTVFVTHAHWDHVGGQAWVRGEYPNVRFIGRENFRAELEHDAVANGATLAAFFGSRFSMSDVLAYKPDTVVDRLTDMTIGSTLFRLVPTRGGETEDALMIDMPDSGVLFVGDIAMPYLGAPFVEEGSLDGLLASIDQVAALKPTHILHGHEALTRVFTSSEMLVDLKGKLVWLRDAVVDATHAGAQRSAIHAMNLVAPGLEKSSSDTQLAYLVLRENVIDRLFDQHTGYWQSGVKGLDHLSDAERGAALSDYLGVSATQVASGAKRMMADGHHELAATTLQAWRAGHPGEHDLDSLYEEANLKLMEKYQDFNPFKFIVYGAEAKQQTRLMSRP
jgi:glyoxylase-like metal-dependent hydrolase (beta-lactamase superfamily II)